MTCPYERDIQMHEGIVPCTDELLCSRCSADMVRRHYPQLGERDYSPHIVAFGVVTLMAAIILALLSLRS